MKVRMIEDVRGVNDFRAVKYIGPNEGNGYRPLSAVPDWISKATQIGVGGGGLIRCMRPEYIDFFQPEHTVEFILKNVGRDRARPGDWIIQLVEDGSWTIMGDKEFWQNFVVIGPETDGEEVWLGPSAPCTLDVPPLKEHEHQWEEVPGEEPPYDVCVSCGDVRH